MAGVFSAAFGLKAFLLSSHFIDGVTGVSMLLAAATPLPLPDVTHDLLLTAVFGGVFIGAGIGLAMLAGGWRGALPAPAYQPASCKSTKQRFLAKAILGF